MSLPDVPGMFKSRITICGITFPNTSSALFPSEQVSRSKSSCRVRAKISFRVGSSSMINASDFVMDLSHGSHWKQDCERGPCCRLAFKHDLAIHQLYELLRNG